MSHSHIYHPTQSLLDLVPHIVLIQPCGRSLVVVLALHSTLSKTDDIRRGVSHSLGGSQLGRNPSRVRFFPCGDRGASNLAVHRIHEMRRRVACWCTPHPHKNGCWVLCDILHRQNITPSLYAQCCL